MQFWIILKHLMVSHILKHTHLLFAWLISVADHDGQQPFNFRDSEGLNMAQLCSGPCSVHGVSMYAHTHNHTYTHIYIYK